MAGKPAGERLVFRLAEAADSELAAHDLRRADLGQLYLPTGRLLICDPTPGMSDSEPLERAVAPGRYLVSAFAHEDRNAFALLRFSTERIARWETAPIELIVDGGESSRYSGGCIVDSGFAGFMDMETHSLIDLRDNAEQDDNPDYEGYIFDVLLESFFDEEAGLHCPIKGDPRNVAAFTSGYGDGEYPAFWGLDAADSPVLLLCDFLVIERS